MVHRSKLHYTKLYQITTGKSSALLQQVLSDIYNPFSAEHFSQIAFQ